MEHPVNKKNRRIPIALIIYILIVSTVITTLKKHVAFAITILVLIVDVLVKLISRTHQVNIRVSTFKNLKFTFYLVFLQFLVINLPV